MQRLPAFIINIHASLFRQKQEVKKQTKINKNKYKYCRFLLQYTPVEVESYLPVLDFNK